MDPYSSPYTIPNNRPYNPFPPKHQGLAEGFGDAPVASIQRKER